MLETPQSKAFRRAVEVFGSLKALSHWLKVPSDTITTWINGEGTPPSGIFLQVANLLERADKEVTSPRSSPVNDNSPGIGLGMRILIADDDRDTLMTLGILLRSEGFDVRLVQGSGEVPSAVRVFRPHAVLLDLAIPDRNGYEVATELTQTYGNAGPVLIAVTALTGELDKRSAELCGIHHLVPRPYNAESLLALLASLREKR